MRPHTDEVRKWEQLGRPNPYYSSRVRYSPEEWMWIVFVFLTIAAVEIGLVLIGLWRLGVIW